jgi:hypothetical protein
MTLQQTDFINRLLSARAQEKNLQERITEALEFSAQSKWVRALHDLITILGDGDESY